MVHEQSAVKVATGQRFIIIAILIFIVTYILTGFHPTFSIIGLAVLGLALFGTINLCNGMGYSVGLIILCCVLLFIPCVSLITLVVLNIKAVDFLKANGYNVGFFGVKSHN
jgi:hypothetical protein